MTAPTERDQQAEQDHARFTGWMESRSYSTHPDDCEGMEEAFTVGMQAQRDLDAAAIESEIASLADQRNRVSDTADQLREQLAATKLVLQETSRESSQRGQQVRHLRDALERCRDAADRSPAAAYAIAMQALASNPAPEMAATEPGA
jgi:chromosome segregation ATPase